MPTNIKVAVRIRPLLPKEKKVGHTSSYIIPNTSKKEIMYN